MTMPLHKSCSFLIVALMLLMQIATVVHAIEHNNSDHTEICAAFTAAEQFGDTPQEYSFPQTSLINHYVCKAAPQPIVLTKRVNTLSRAPPALP